MRKHIEMLSKINRLNKQIEEAKKDFVEFIQDKSYDLEERFAVFRTAPDVLKEHQTYVQRFKSLGDTDRGDRAIGYYCWLRHVERYEIVDTKDIIESAECYNEERDDPDMRIVDIPALKEEILQANLGSYEYDW